MAAERESTISRLNFVFSPFVDWICHYMIPKFPWMDTITCLCGDSHCRGGGTAGDAVF